MIARVLAGLSVLALFRQLRYLWRNTSGTQPARLSLGILEQACRLDKGEYRSEMFVSSHGASDVKLRCVRAR